MSWRKLSIVPVVVFFALMLDVPAAHAQFGPQHSIEITPFGGYRFGGIVDFSDLSNGSVSTPCIFDYPPPPATATACDDRWNIRSSVNYGAIFDYSIWPGLAAEFMWNQQPTQFQGHDLSTGQTSERTSADLTNYSFGFEFQIHPPEAKFHPFVAGGIGFTHWSAGPYYGKQILGYSNALSYNFGLGAKYYLTNHFGLRAEVRWMPSRTTPGGTSCDYYGYCYQNTNHAEQGAADLGLIIRLR